MLYEARLICSCFDNWYPNSPQAAHQELPYLLTAITEPIWSHVFDVIFAKFFKSWEYECMKGLPKKSHSQKLRPGESNDYFQGLGDIWLLFAT